jgi:glycosyltransferase involved in cell wall biosynthesis
MTEIKSNADIEPCLSVVMPVFNEAATVENVVKNVLAQRPVQQLVIVDDASTDGTWGKLQPLAQNEPRIKLVRHEVNQGKGAALRTGLALANITGCSSRFCPARRTWCSVRGFWAAPAATAFCITGIRSATKS